MPYEFNPLLKDGFQKSADTASIESEISDLQQKKITKFFSASDTLQPGEIAQYQGPDDAVNGLLNGLFYKCVENPVVLPVGTHYFEYSAQSDINQVGNIAYNNFTVNYGDKFFVVDDNVSITPVDIYVNFFSHQYQYIWFGDVNNLHVGDKSYNCLSGNHCTFTQVFPNYILSDGGTIKNTQTAYSSYTKVSKVLSLTGTYYYLVDFGRTCYILLELNSLFTSVVDWQPVFMADGITETETVVNFQKFVNTDVQKRIQGVENAQDGSLVISRDVEFSGDITVRGTQTIVDTQEIDSENDFINLRVNNPLALAEGEMSGLSVKNYDGNGNNLDLVVDKNGWARVGDENGTLQKLATIEENPTDGEFVKYNTTTKQLESGTIPTPAEATTTTAGLMSAADKVKLDNLSVSAVTSYTKSNSTFKFYKYGRLVNVFIICNSTSSSPISLTIDAAFAPLEYVGAYGVPFMSSGSCSIDINGTTLSFIGKGAICLSYLAAS